MTPEETINTSGLHQVELIKPVDYVNRDSTSKERREKKQQREPESDEVLLSQEAIQAQLESQTPEKSDSETDVESNNPEIHVDIHV